MPSVRIPKEYTTGNYYLTFTVKNWYYIFDRHNRFEMLADSLKYCQKHKELKIYAYVFMLNHIHLIVSSPDIIGFVRDFKKFTSKEIQKNIIATEPNVLSLFNIGDGKYEFWAKTNMPKVIETMEYLVQKINYVHTNPVRKQYVKKPEDWVWSSANPESEILIEPILF
ncbi:MAG: transposase [Nitrospirae bacterium]|nr:transposase [Nitrospirota bacterium]